MKIDKAVEELKSIIADGFLEGDQNLEGAVQLGIEALKREKANRGNPDFVMVGKLPGETKE